MVAENNILQGCLNNIKHQSGLMKDNLSEGHLLLALKNCSNFLNELRTSQLSPKEYYELYMAVFDSLESLSGYLLQSHKSKQSKKKGAPFLADLYELVQYSGNIVPRLYMMIVIGTTYMSTNEAPTKEIMKDMIEMCRGVQHPIRGLFLRNYLSQRSKDLLPLSTKEDFDETVDFLVVNFIEMNKLWVRLQHQGHSSERELRYQERKELKILVGSNLVRLSQVVDDFHSEEGYSSEQFYKDRIFPTITEQIIQCRDHLAQSYLIDVLIQIFPDNFHFLTLDSLLNDVFLKLHPMLKKSELVETLVDRFVTYHKYESDLESVTEGTAELDSKPEPTQKEKSGASISEIFDSFWKFFLNLHTVDPELPTEEYSTILQSLIKLSLTFDPNNYENLDKIYQFATEKLTEYAHPEGDAKTEAGTAIQSLWFDLLVTPVKHFSSIKSLLKLPFFFELFSKMSTVSSQRQLALKIAEKLVEIYGSDTDAEKEEYHTTEDIDDIFKFMLVLIKDSDSQMNTSKNLGVTKTILVDNGEKHITAEFLEIQETICKVLHLVDHPDEFKSLTNLLYVRKKYLNKNPENIIYTYPTLIAQLTNKLRIAGYRQLSKKKADGADQADLMITSSFKNISVVIDELYQHHQQSSSELILKLYLNAATVADQLQQETIAYELFNQCFVVYEENLILNSSQNQMNNPHESMGGPLSYQAILMVANRLANLRYFNKENYESLITKITLYGSKLLKKQNQCRSVYYCAHLWWWCDLWIEGKSPTVEVAQTEEDTEAAIDNETEVATEQAEKEITLDEKEDVVEVKEEQVLYRDAKRVLECLQKALRVADSCMDPYLLLKLFVEILNRCLIFNVYGNWLTDARYINGLIDLIRTNLASFRDDTTRDEDDQEAKLLRQIEGFFDRTLVYVREQQETEDRFQDIII